MATQLIGMERASGGCGWRPDVIHAHVFEAGFPAVLLGRRLGCPVVVSEHFTAFQRGLVRGMDRRLARFTFRHADLVCPVSEGLRRSSGRSSRAVATGSCPNVVDTSIFHPRAARAAVSRCGCSTSPRWPTRSATPTCSTRCRGLRARRSTSSARASCCRAARAVGRLGLGDTVRFLGPRHPAAVAEAMRACRPVRAAEPVREPAGRAARGDGQWSAGRRHPRRRRSGDRRRRRRGSGGRRATWPVSRARSSRSRHAGTPSIRLALADRAERGTGSTPSAPYWDEIYDEVATRRRAPAARAPRRSS